MTEGEGEKITTRYHVGGISEKEEDFNGLLNVFKRFGEIVDSHFTSKHFAYVTLKASEKEISKCINGLNSTKWKGTTIKIETAKATYTELLKKKWQMEEEEELNQKKKEEEKKMKEKEEEEKKKKEEEKKIKKRIAKFKDEQRRRTQNNKFNSKANFGPKYKKFSIYDDDSEFLDYFNDSKKEKSKKNKEETNNDFEEDFLDIRKEKTEKKVEKKVEKIAEKTEKKEEKIKEKIKEEINNNKQQITKLIPLTEEEKKQRLQQKIQKKSLDDFLGDENEFETDFSMKSQFGTGQQSIDLIKLNRKLQSDPRFVIDHRFADDETPFDDNYNNINPNNTNINKLININSNINNNNNNNNINNSKKEINKIEEKKNINLIPKKLTKDSITEEDRRLNKQLQEEKDKALNILNFLDISTPDPSPNVVTLDRNINNNLNKLRGKRVYHSDSEDDEKDDIKNKKDEKDDEKMEIDENNDKNNDKNDKNDDKSDESSDSSDSSDDSSDDSDEENEEKESEKKEQDPSKKVVINTPWNALQSTGTTWSLLGNIINDNDKENVKENNNNNNNNNYVNNEKDDSGYHDNFDEKIDKKIISVTSLNFDSSEQPNKKRLIDTSIPLFSFFKLTQDDKTVQFMRHKSLEEIEAQWKESKKNYTQDYKRKYKQAIRISKLKSKDERMKMIFQVLFFKWEALLTIPPTKYLCKEYFRFFQPLFQSYIFNSICTLHNHSKKLKPKIFPRNLVFSVQKGEETMKISNIPLPLFGVSFGIAFIYTTYAKQLKKWEKNLILRIEQRKSEVLNWDFSKLNTTNKSDELVVFVVETTCINNEKNGDVVEFGAIILDKYSFKEKARFETFIYSPNITSNSIKINQITEEMILEFPTFEEIIEQIYEILHSRVWAAFAVSSSSQIIIENAFKKINQKAPKAFDFIDTEIVLKKSGELFDDQIQFSSLSNYYKLGDQNHRAISDCVRNIELLKNCALKAFINQRCNLNISTDLKNYQNEKTIINEENNNNNKNTTTTTTETKIKSISTTTTTSPPNNNINNNININTNINSSPKRKINTKSVIKKKNNTINDIIALKDMLMNNNSNNNNNSIDSSPKRNKTKKFNSSPKRNYNYNNNNNNNNNKNNYNNNYYNANNNNINYNKDNNNINQYNNIIIQNNIDNLNDMLKENYEEEIMKIESCLSASDEIFLQVTNAINEQKQLTITYYGGSSPSSTRVITPLRFRSKVLFDALCHRDNREKTFSIAKITQIID